MDNIAIVQEIITSVNERLLQNNFSTPPNFLYDWIVAAILENNAIIPNNLEVDYTSAERFAEVLRQWIHIESDKSDKSDKSDNIVNIDSNDTSQILQQLAQEGWKIIPPQ